MDIFSISTPRDFFEQLVIPEYEDFKKDNSCQRRAITSMIFAYHFYEKVYSRKFDKASSGMTATDAENFDAARELVNGTKHIRMKLTTSVQRGFSSDFSSDFERPLTIEVAGSQKGMDEVLAEIISYWEVAGTNGVF